MVLVRAAGSDPNSGSVVVNRCALVALLVVYPLAQSDLNAYYSKFNRAEKHTILTEGLQDRMTEHLHKLLRWTERITYEVTNPFVSTYPQLRTISPQLGKIKDGEQLRSILNDLKTPNNFE